MICSVTQYLTRRYGFTATWTPRSSGIIEATLTRRSPGLVRPMASDRPPATTSADDERFTAATQSEALAAVRLRIIELDGEILSEKPTREDSDD